MNLLQYLIGELNYGGKIIYQEDKEVLNLTVKHFVNHDVCLQSGNAPPGCQQTAF